MLSLKAFHILFVAVSTLSMLLIGAVCAAYSLSSGRTELLAMAGCGLGATVLLALYGAWFLGKIKRMHLT